jgi:hypothetical protein
MFQKTEFPTAEGLLEAVIQILNKVPLQIDGCGHLTRTVVTEGGGRGYIVIAI